MKEQVQSIEAWHSKAKVAKLSKHAKQSNQPIRIKKFRDAGSKTPKRRGLFSSRPFIRELLF